MLRWPHLYSEGCAQVWPGVCTGLNLVCSWSIPGVVGVGPQRGQLEPGVWAGGTQGLYLCPLTLFHGVNREEGTIYDVGPSTRVEHRECWVKGVPGVPGVYHTYLGLGAKLGDLPARCSVRFGPGPLTGRRRGAEEPHVLPSREMNASALQ